MHGFTQLNNFVISTGAKRSGEICGFFLILTRARCGAPGGCCAFGTPVTRNP
jgi:hypothetical protein